LKAKDGTILVGRTMEFGADLGWQMMVVPKGIRFRGTGSSGDGHTWEASHSFLGISALGRLSAVDGLNDSGLYAALLYLPGFSKYEAHEGMDPSKLVAPDEVASLVLATSATVDEAIAAIESVVVWNKFEDQLQGTLPIHLVLHDRNGEFAVVEWVDGARSVHRNSLGVCTNSPPYDWHETNLRNYVNLKVVNADPVELDGETFAQIGEGSGLLGLPGDWTPPSRFVRAAVLSSATTPPKDGPSGILTTLHVLNAFDIPRGLVGGESGGDYTQWVTVADLASKQYVVRTYESTTPTQFGLETLDSGGRVQRMPLPETRKIPVGKVYSRQ
jgi:choloylglycine hydrolase